MPRASCPECGEPIDFRGGTCPSCAPTGLAGSVSEQLTRTGPLPTTSTGHEESFPRPFGRLTLVGQIGRGGMGVVYQAEDPKLRRTVALKILSLDESDNTARERFLREARIAGNLDHPNVVPVYDCGSEGETLYYTMPLVRGMSLERALSYIHGKNDRPPPDWLPVPGDRMGRIGLILQWFEGALAGLHHAHEHGIIHRDIKPPNLLLDSETNRLRIADFGLARAGPATVMTRTGTMMGTVAYMAPEQVRGDTEHLDRRCDIYAMGVSLFRALLHRYPYEAGSTADYLNKILTAPAAAAERTSRALPRDLLTILLKAMEKSPADRYATAAELAEDIGRFRGYEPIHAHPVGPLGRLARWARRKPAVATLLGIVGVATIGLAVLWVEVARSSRILAAQEIANTFIDASYESSAGNGAAARAGFDRVLELEPDHFGALLARAQSVWADTVRLRRAGGAIDEGAVDLALADLRRADALRPALVGTHALRERLLDLAGRAEEAEGAREAVAGRSPATATDYELLGNLARADGRLEEAVELYDRAMRLDNQRPTAELNRGLVLKKLGRLDRALVDFEVLSRVWPDHAMSYANLGNTLHLLDRVEDALAAFERAIRIDPDHPDIRYNHGRVLAQVGRLEDAERELRHTITLRPDSPKARNMLGRVYVKAGRLEEATAVFRKALTIEGEREGGPDRETWGNVHTNLCDVSLLRRDLETARIACPKCVELFPGKPVSHYNLAMLRMLEGDAGGALALLERNVELGDTDWNYLLNKDPVFQPLHDDPRFVALIERMKALAG